VTPLASSSATGGLIKAVVFDMDGVLFEGRNFWMDPHLLLGGDVVEARSLLDRYLDADYAMLAEEIVGKRWRGKAAKPYLELVAERRYQLGVRETVAFLRESGIATAIVSSGPDLLAERAKRELGVDAIRANGVEIRDGRISGTATIRVPQGEKAAVALDVLTDFGVGADQVAAVGDSDADVALAERVAVPIAYDSSSERLTNIAAHKLKHGELSRVRQIVESMSR
jgi:HAD superfamily phosphoserine phosphatase-like hydrolase